MILKKSADDKTVQNYPAYKELTLVLLNIDFSIFENTVDPDQLASDKAI